MSIETLLSRLTKVKRSSSNSWVACCPAHEDRTPSLTIRDAGDGRILIHCFSGCETESVLGAVGMDWEDVMPPKVIDHHVKPVKLYASDALKAIQYEARLVAVAAYDMAKGNKLDDESMKRLVVAVERINEAMELTNG